MRHFGKALLFFIFLAGCVPLQTEVVETQTLLTSVPEVTALPQTSTPEPSPTVTPTQAPALTATATMVPAEKILLLEDFEDNQAGEWYTWLPGMQKKKGANWKIVQGADGNHYASAFGHAEVEDIWYVNNTSGWTDYAFETRIRFVNAAKLKLFTHADGGHANNVVGLFPEGGIYFAQWKQSVGYTDFGMTFSDLFVPDQWYTITVETLGDTLRLYIDHSLVREEKLPVPLVNEKGGIGFEVTGDELDLDDIRVWSLQ